MIKQAQLEAVLFIHRHHQTGELIQVSILELSGSKIPISVIEYLESDDCLNNEDFDELPLDEPITVSLTMEWEEGDTSVGLLPGWYIDKLERLKQGCPPPHTLQTPRTGHPRRFAFPVTRK